MAKFQQGMFPMIVAVELGARFVCIAYQIKGELSGTVADIACFKPGWGMRKAYDRVTNSWLNKGYRVCVYDKAEGSMTTMTREATDELE